MGRNSVKDICVAGIQGWKRRVLHWLSPLKGRNSRSSSAVGLQVTACLQVSHVNSFETLCCYNTIHFTCALLENLKVPCPVKYDSLLINVGLGSKLIDEKLYYVSRYFCGLTSVWISAEL